MEIRPGKTRDALSSEVFSFADAVEDDRETGSSDDRRRSSDDPRRSSDDRRRSSDDRRRSSDRTSPPSSSGVTPEELSSAVREMLTRAGAPPTLDQTAMLAAHERLRDRLSAAVAAAAGAEKDRSDAFAAADAASRAFHCPITQARMSDPVVALDGHTYERRAIEQWFSQGRLTSPVTNLRLPATTLVPNHALKSAADAMEDSVLGADAPSRER